MESDRDTANPTPTIYKIWRPVLVSYSTASADAGMPRCFCGRVLDGNKTHMCWVERP